MKKLIENIKSVAAYHEAAKCLENRLKRKIHNVSEFSSGLYELMSEHGPIEKSPKDDRNLSEFLSAGGDMDKHHYHAYNNWFLNLKAQISDIDAEMAEEKNIFDDNPFKLLLSRRERFRDILSLTKRQGSELKIFSKPKSEELRTNPWSYDQNIWHYLSPYLGITPKDVYFYGPREKISGNRSFELWDFIFNDTISLREAIHTEAVYLDHEFGGLFDPHISAYEMSNMIIVVLNNISDDDPSYPKIFQLLGISLLIIKLAIRERLSGGHNIEIRFDKPHLKLWKLIIGLKVYADMFNSYGILSRINEYIEGLESYYLESPISIMEPPAKQKNYYNPIK